MTLIESISHAPLAGKPWPEQGGIYVGKRLIGGRLHHVIAAPCVESDIQGVSFYRVDDVAAHIGEYRGHADWLAPEKEDLMLAYINAAEQFVQSGTSSIYWSRSEQGDWPCAVDFELGRVEGCDPLRALRLRPFRYSPLEQESANESLNHDEASRTPDLGQPWPEQGGIYIGWNVIDGVRHHLIIAPGIESDICGVKFADVKKAVAKVKKTKLNGHSDWRAPNQRELMTAFINAADQFVQSGAGSVYWSCSRHRAWPLSVDFEDGHVGTSYHHNEFRVRPIRSIIESEQSKG